MLWFPTLIGTLCTTIGGLLVLILVARGVGNRLSTLPLVLRTAVAVCMTTWIFAAAGNHGVGFAALPSIVVFFMMALGPLDADGSMFAVLVLMQLLLFAGVFVYNSADFRSVVAKRPPLNKTFEILSALALLTIAFSVPVIFKMTRPCDHEYNGKCYDSVEANNAPLNFQLQLLDLDTQKPIAGAIVRLDWATPQPRMHSKCVRTELLSSDAQGWVRSLARDPNWIPGDALIVIPGYEAVSFLPFEQFPTHLSNFVVVEQDDHGKYPAWEANLASLGYSGNAMSAKYVKAFPLPNAADQIRLTQPATTGTGKLQYWLTARELPSPYLYQQISGTICDGDASTESLSAQAKQQFQHALRVTAKKRLCDAKWDSVIAQSTVTPQLLDDILRIFDNPKAKANFIEANSSIRNIKLGYPERGPSLTQSERLSFCTAIEPFFQPSVDQL